MNDALHWFESRLVDVGGRRLAVSLAGEGQPAVVLEMGLGVGGSFFLPIAQEVAAFAQVVWYDRAGVGKSDPAPKPRTVADLARDLHALLGAINIPAPFVLVGHSLGGVTVRYYQHLFPEEVGALVLVDSAHEDQRERLLVALRPEAPDEAPAIAQSHHALTVLWDDPTANSEGIDNVANTALMRDCGDLGDLPLVVISRGNAIRPDGFPADEFERRERVWRDLQIELAALSSNCEHIIAERSGHLISAEQPELIVAGVERAIALMRARG